MSVDDIATIPFSKEVLFVFKVDENEKLWDETERRRKDKDNALFNFTINERGMFNIWY
jgi:hypothetical protein